MSVDVAVNVSVSVSVYMYVPGSSRFIYFLDDDSRATGNNHAAKLAAGLQPSQPHTGILFQF